MGFLLHIPVVLSFILLAAHFMRGGQTFVVIVVLIIPFVLLLRKAWAVRLVQVALLLGCLEWLRTLIELQGVRAEYGLPWLRLVIIIGVVVVFTGTSAFVFFHKSLVKKYALTKTPRAIDS